MTVKKFSDTFLETVMEEFSRISRKNLVPNFLIKLFQKSITQRRFDDFEQNETSVEIADFETREFDIVDIGFGAAEII